MLHHSTRAESIGNYLKRAGDRVLEFFRLDITETKWGHRVMDQIFREGKFSTGQTQEREDKAHEE